MTKKSENRYATMKEFALAIADFLKTKADEPAEKERPPAERMDWKSPAPNPQPFWHQEWSSQNRLI